MNLQSLWWNIWESVRWDVPKVVMVVLMFGFIWSVWIVQKRPNFDFADIYKDDNGKVSAARFAGVGTWVACTWYVMQDMMDGVPTAEIFGLYAGIFSGAGVAVKAIEKWKGGS